ncbi:RNA-directed DNA polymerase, eukaryota [Tanacetum coccineum]
MARINYFKFNGRRAHGMEGVELNFHVNMPPLLPDVNRTYDDAGTLAQIMHQTSLDVGFPHGGLGGIFHDFGVGLGGLGGDGPGGVLPDFGVGFGGLGDGVVPPGYGCAAPGGCRYIEENSDSEKVPDTIIEDEELVNKCDDEMNSVKNLEKSEDPFNIYSLLNRKDSLNKKEKDSESSLSHPPGYTPPATKCPHDQRYPLNYEDYLGHSLRVGKGSFVVMASIKDWLKCNTQCNRSLKDKYKEDLRLIDVDIDSALFPKIPDANLVKDFRPISLIGSIYKIIAKILTNRLVKVIGDIVSDVQSAFIKGRQILDGPFILNEVIQWCKRKKKHALIFKVDFEKAFDSVRWDFLDDILRKFGFGTKWREWIQKCLVSSRGSILINGSPTEEFQFFKGLKQGDPLSPFLFILVMECLHISFQKVVDAGKFTGINLNQSTNLSHMFYADDAIIRGPGTKWVEHVVEQRRGNEVIEKVRSHDFPNGNEYLIQLLVRLTLLKSVLGSIPIFHMSIFRVPLGVLQKLESIRPIHGKDGNVDLVRNTRINSLLDILSKKVKSSRTLDVNVSEWIRLKLGNGESTSFWGGIEQSQLMPLVNLVILITVTPKIDRWVWSLEGSGEFSVASIRKVIDANRLKSKHSMTRWVKFVPIKINVLAWKIKMDALPSRFNISRRGIDISSLTCPICDAGIETTDHLFFSCLCQQITHKMLLGGRDRSGGHQQLDCSDSCWPSPALPHSITR